MSDLTLVRVRCRNAQGMYRCGKFWPSTWTEAQLTAEQLEALDKPPFVVHRAGQRNPELPSVNEVQPGANNPPEPEPWGDQHLEKLRQEALELDRRVEERRENSKANAAASASEAASDERVVPPVVKQHQNQNRHR